MTTLRRSWEADTVCSLLRCEYRRQVLRSLGDETTMTRGELVEAIVDESRQESRDSVAINLHHVALPRLAAEDAVRYDAGAGEVTLTERGEELLPYLDAVEETH